METLGTLVAELGDEPVGIAGLVLLKDGDGELAALYVLPEHQGRGVGQALCEASVAEFKGRGCAGMRVWVLAGAAHFYERRDCDLVEDGEFRLGVRAEGALGYHLIL